MTTKKEEIPRYWKNWIIYVVGVIVGALSTLAIMVMYKGCFK